MKQSDVKAAAKARTWAAVLGFVGDVVVPAMVDFWAAVKRAFWAAVAWAYVAAKWVKDQAVELYHKVF